MSLIVLKNLKCEFTGAGTFAVTWDSPTNIQVRHIVMAEINEQGNIQIDNKKLIKLEKSQTSHNWQSDRINSIHRFLVVAVTEDSETDRNIPQNACNHIDASLLCCQGLSIAGTITWEYKNISEQVVLITITSTQPVPGGFLHYGYHYENVRFLFPVLNPMEKQKNGEYKLHVRFFLPPAASHIFVEVPGANLHIRQQNNGGLLNGFFKFFHLCG